MQVSRSQMSVSLGHFNALVTQKFFDGVQIYSPHHKPARKGMSQVMPMEISDPCLVQAFLPSLRDVLEPLSFQCSVEHVNIADHTRQTLERIQDYLVHWNVTRFCRLRVSHRDDFLSEVYILPLQAELLSLSQACM